MPNRPPIPEELKRRVLLEAGHRCAIPTCRFPNVEIAHIKPWAQVREHAFGNLIALCANCHARYDRGEIDRKSIMAYKAALAAVPTVEDRLPLAPVRFVTEGEWDADRMELVDSSGLTSITDNGTGDVTLNFAIAYESDRYAALITPQDARYKIVERTAGSLRLQTLDAGGSRKDVPFAFRISGRL